jgi:beta-lactam-binding protein with PASTA domain
LKGREFEEDKQLETNKRFVVDALKNLIFRISNTSEIRSRKTAPGKLITNNTRIDTSTRGGKRIDIKQNPVSFQTSLSPDFLNLFAN